MENISDNSKSNPIPKKFFYNTSILAIGTLASQVITFGVSLVLTRLFSVEAIGSWSVYLSIVAILSTIVTARYEYAIVLPESDEEAANVLVLSCFLLILIVMCGTLIVVIGWPFFQPFFEQQSIDDAVWLLPASLLGVGLFSIFNYWCTRKEQFSIVAIRNLVNSGVSGVAEIGLGIFMVFGQLGLIVGSVFGTLFSGVFICGISALKDRKIFIPALSFNKILDVAKKYKKFPLFSSWSALLNQLSTTIATFMLVIMFGSVVVGYFSIAQQLLLLPMSIVGGAIGQAFYPAMVSSIRENTISSLVSKMIELLSKICLVPMALIALCAPSLFAVIYGADWIVAGEYARLLLPWLLVVFVVSPLTVIFDAMGKQKQYLAFNLVIFIARIVVLLFGGWTGNEYFTIALYSCIGCVHFLIVGTYIAHLSKVPIRYFFTLWLAPLKTKSILCLLIPAICSFLGVGVIIEVAVCVLSGLCFLMIEGRPLVALLMAKG